MLRCTAPTLNTAPTPALQVLLAALAALYAVAFTSLLLAGPGLLGPGGAAPAEAYLRLSAEQLLGTPNYARCGTL